MSGEISLPNDAYGHTVTMRTDGTNDNYVVGGSTTYSFPAGTDQNIAYLSFTIQINLAAFLDSFQTYMQNLFSIELQIHLITLYLAADAGGLTTRKAYIGKLLTWLNLAEAYAASYIVSVESMTDATAVAATKFDAAQIPAPPDVSVVGAIMIPN